MFEKLTCSVTVLAVIFIVFIVVDCSAGKSRFVESKVVDHRYEDAWTEVLSSDPPSIQHHPEEWHVVCSESGGSMILDVTVTKDHYYRLTNNQDVTVIAKQGRFTSSMYPLAIEP